MCTANDNVTASTISIAAKYDDMFRGQSFSTQMFHTVFTIFIICFICLCLCVCILLLISLASIYFKFSSCGLSFNSLRCGIHLLFSMWVFSSSSSTFSITGLACVANGTVGNLFVAGEKSRCHLKSHRMTEKLSFLINTNRTNHNFNFSHFHNSLSLSSLYLKVSEPLGSYR